MSNAYLVRIEALEKINSLLEIITDFFLGLVVGVAARLDGVDASAYIIISAWSGLPDRHKRTMLVPLVLPEALVITLVVLPVGLHVGQQLGPALRLEDLCDVRILARRIAELLVGAVAVVRPALIVSGHIFYYFPLLGHTKDHEQSRNLKDQWPDWCPRIESRGAILQDN